MHRFFLKHGVVAQFPCRHHPDHRLDELLCADVSKVETASCRSLSTACKSVSHVSMSGFPPFPRKSSNAGQKHRRMVVAQQGWPKTRRHLAQTVCDSNSSRSDSDFGVWYSLSLVNVHNPSSTPTRGLWLQRKSRRHEEKDWQDARVVCPSLVSRLSLTAVVASLNSHVLIHL